MLPFSVLALFLRNPPPGQLRTRPGRLRRGSGPCRARAAAAAAAGAERRPAVQQYGETDADII